MKLNPIKDTDMKRIHQKLTSEAEKSTISSDSQSETVKADRNLVGKICEGRAERGTQKGCVIIKEKPSREFLQST